MVLQPAPIFRSPRLPMLPGIQPHLTISMNRIQNLKNGSNYPPDKY